MKIAYISAGAAGMYCGSCLHDNVLAAALKRQGHDVALIPTYTPMRTDDQDVSLGYVFYGAVNVYLQQKSALFRRTPRALTRWLDGRRLLDKVSGLQGSTSGDDLASLTLSVLQGELGHQAKELERLVGWLKSDFRPDVVHLTNSMFLGMARSLGAVLGVPVVCSLQGEDLFIDAMSEPYKSEVLGELRERAPGVARFTAPSRYYREHMAAMLKVDPERIAVVPLGIKLDGHGAPAEAAPEDAGERPCTIGYLARVAPEKGLHHLVDALKLLSDEHGAERIRVRAAGYLGPRDRAYLAEQQKKVAAWGLDGSFAYEGEVDRAGKLAFLSGIDALCVPTDYREAKGRFALEALASGVPLVLPRHGSFPELIEATGGGLLIEPGSPQAVAAGLAELMRDPDRRRELGRRGRAAVHANHGDQHMAERMLAVYRDVRA